MMGPIMRVARSLVAGGRSLVVMAVVLAAAGGADVWTARGLAQSARKAPAGAGAGGAAAPAAAAADIKGRTLFTGRCAGCHGLDARGGEAPAIGPGTPAAGRTDDRLQTIIHDGTQAGMPGFGALLSRADILALVAHLRTLQRAGSSADGSGGGAIAAGDAAAGKALFFGKAKCADCHMARGEGGFLASDLTRTRLDANAIRAAIVRPPASPKGVLTTVTLRDGKTISGIVRNEDNFSLQLQDDQGAFHLIDKAATTAINRAAEPIMPGDYRQRLSDAEIDHLLSFIASLPSGR